MPRPALDLDNLGGVVSAASLLEEQRSGQSRPHWGPELLAGRLVELSGDRASAALTMAMGLVWQVQRAGEPTAWVSAGQTSFYPPDVARGGVDLAALAVVRVDGSKRAARAADKLARSGAFGLVVVDLDEHTSVPTPLMRRLQKWAEQHQTVLLCLTARPKDAPSLSPLVSLRAVAQRRRVAEDRFSCRVEVIRDKRGGPGAEFEEVCCGPPGLR
jgi:recombination protein RecA